MKWFLWLSWTHFDTIIVYYCVVSLKSEDFGHAGRKTTSVTRRRQGIRWDFRYQTHPKQVSIQDDECWLDGR